MAGEELMAAGSSHGSSWRGWAVSIVPLGFLLWFLALLPGALRGDIWSVSVPWIPQIGVFFSLRADGLALLFAILISGIGMLIFGYGGHYLAGHRYFVRCYVYLVAFMISMLGLVLAGDLITMFVFWELTSITSYLLIGLDHEREAARKAALQALLVTGGGGLALMVGFLMLGRVGGSFDLVTLAPLGAVVLADPLYLPILLLILAGAFTKSAQFPFHFWLPNAMEAPTPISAYLHSATMVKAGVYLLARLTSVLSGSTEWTLLLTGFGAATMLLGAVMAFLVSDLKRILAYSTISALGTMVLLLGPGTPAAVNAAIVFLLAHALYKAALFMIAGIIDHQTGTRDVTILSGLRAAMPVTAVVAAVAAISLAGFGPVLSFIAKEMLLETVLAAGNATILAPVAIISAALLTATACILAIRPFYGPRCVTPVAPTEASPGFLAGPVVLASIGLLFGIVPQFAGAMLIAPAVAAIMPQSEALHLALWHGLNVPLLLSVVSVTVGVVLFVTWERFSTFRTRLPEAARFGPAALWDNTVEATVSFAAWQSRILQNGYLRIYLLMILMATLLFVGFSFLDGLPLISTADVSDVQLHEVVVAAVILVATLFIIRSDSRLGAVAGLGVVGYSVALLYTIFSAPDLAMTQFAIETLTVVLFVLVLYHLPRFSALSSPATRLRDAVVSIAVGAMVTVLVLGVTATNAGGRVTSFYAEQSVIEAHGRNVVNVILVDFRGLDTLGEITVLAIAGLGVYGLLKLRVERSGS
jgi:multicomponent Na+:H+ antiporter subunit A